MKKVSTRGVLALIVDYGMGNAGSVKNSLEALAIPSILSSKPEDFKKASHIILPGVGAFGECMKNLEKQGLLVLLNEEVIKKRKPFLGICLGMQILAEFGEEGGRSKGLNWISGETIKLKAKNDKFPLPHVGWNDVVIKSNSKLFTGITNPIFYFVHSYHFVPKNNKVIAGKTDYGQEFVSAVELGNIFGVQFHPEKSQRQGLKLLENFLSI